MRITTIIFFLAISLYKADALESREVTDGNVSFRLISSHEELSPGSDFMLGVMFEIKEGWHIYWKNAGDSGLPTSLKFDLPDGLELNKILWPLPDRIPFSGMYNFGYSDQVMLIAKIEYDENVPKVHSDSLKISLNADWLVCKEKCIPGAGKAQITIPVAEKYRKSETKIFEKTLNKVPGKYFGKAEAQINKEFMILKFRFDSSQMPDSIDFLPAEGGYFDYSGYRSNIENEVYLLKIPLAQFRIGQPDSANGVIILWRKGKKQFFEINLPVL